MAVISTNAIAGVAGEITRPAQTLVESAFINASYAPTAFGVPVQMVSGLLRVIAASDLASVFFGILARQAPSMAGDTGAALLTGTPNTSSCQAIVKKGYVAVACTIGTPARGGQAYMRVVADTGKAVGDIEATRDASVAGGTITGTGTGTIAVAEDGTAKAGTWRITLLATSQTAACSVIDPTGNRLKDAVVGTEYVGGGLTFTITAAGTMTAGDYFAPVVTDNNVAIPGATFSVAGKDSNNITELFLA